MTISEAVCGRLKADAAVIALVGPRVYQLKLPQQPTLPAVRVQLVAEPSDPHLRGERRWWQADVQVDAYANEFDPAHPDPYATVSLVADAVDLALTKGPSYWVGALRMQKAKRITRAPLYDANEIRLARIMQEFRCTYRLDRVIALGLSKTA